MIREDRKTPSPIVIVLLFFSLAQLTFAKWEQIGLGGNEITSITTGKYFGDTILVAAAKSNGAYLRVGSSGSFSLLTDLGVDTVEQALKTIRCLYMSARMSIPVLFAGTDSGLFRYVFTSGVPPHWTKAKDIPAEPVFAITAEADTCYCATRSEIYGSFNSGAVWTACSTHNFLPPMQRMSSFTSLSFFQGINAGSQLTPSLQSWDGVLHSSDKGKSWLDISNVPVFSSIRVSSVFSLASYSPMYSQPARLLAGTSGGLLWIDDIDSGTWVYLGQQLQTAPVRNLYVTCHTRSLIADIFASTDSGVYILSDLVKPGEWVLSLRGKASGVTSFASIDPKEWFAAMEDGVYRFTIDNTPAHNEQLWYSSKDPGKVNTKGRFITYTIDGKKMCRNPEYPGVYLLYDTGSRSARRKIVW
jgi:hypothetical protein